VVCFNWLYFQLDDGLYQPFWDIDGLLGNAGMSGCDCMHNFLEMGKDLQYNCRLHVVLANLEP